MLKKISEFTHLTIHASDGEIGHVEECYFDDEKWTVRYLLVNTGSWLAGRRVLISPAFLRYTDWESKQLHVALTKEQVEKSPDIDTHKPVSRQHESEYYGYFGYPYYWGGDFTWGAVPYPSGLMMETARSVSAQETLSKKEAADSHLRSTAAVTGYHIQAADGEIGHVADFIIDQDTWSIRYLEVDTRNWWPGKNVLLGPEWVEQVSWLESTIRVDVSLETIKNAPTFIESEPITREYEQQLHEHYGRLPYWMWETSAAHVRRRNEPQLV